MGDVTKLTPKGGTKPVPVQADVLEEAIRLIEEALARDKERKLKLAHTSR